MEETVGEGIDKSAAAVKKEVSVLLSSLFTPAFFFSRTNPHQPTSDLGEI